MPTDLKPVAPEVLDQANDPAAAHEALDGFLKEFAGTPLSAIVIAYAPNHQPTFKYYGRSLSRTELVGVFSTLATVMGQRT